MDQDSDRPLRDEDMTSAGPAGGGPRSAHDADAQDADADGTDQSADADAQDADNDAQDADNDAQDS